MAERMDDREMHERVADALAAIRFYRQYSGSGGIFPERFKEIIEILYGIGQSRNEKFLMEMVIAIDKGYASGPAPTLPGFKQSQDT
jgi:hypothetical protein